jgi:hypothetical protein
MLFEEKVLKISKITIVAVNIIFSLYLLILLILHTWELFEGSWQTSSYNIEVFSHILLYLYTEIFFIVASIIQVINIFNEGSELNEKIWILDFIAVTTVIVILMFYLHSYKWLFLIVESLNIILKLIIRKIKNKYYFG